MEKFQVLEVVESKPVVVCKVKILEDSDDQTLPMTQLSDSTVQQFKDLVSLNVKMQSLPVQILVFATGQTGELGGTVGNVYPNWPTLFPSWLSRMQHIHR